MDDDTPVTGNTPDHYTELSRLGDIAELAVHLEAATAACSI